MSNYADGTVVELQDASRHRLTGKSTSFSGRTYLESDDGALIGVDKIVRVISTPVDENAKKDAERALNIALVNHLKYDGLDSVEFYYTNAEGDRSFRSVKNPSVTDGTHIGGYDEDREEFRSFRLDRINGIVEAY